MNPSQLIAVFRARWLPGVAVLVLALLAAGVITYFMPKRFAATASVVIDAKPDPVSSMLYGGATSPALINTQLEVIKSDRVALRVVRNLRLAELPGIRGQWEEAGGQISIEAWLVDFLQRGLQVSVARVGGNVVNITMNGNDAQFVAGVANAFTQAYIDTAVELRVDPARQYSGFFEQQTTDARASLERAQGKLSAYQREKGLLATDARFDVETSRLTMLAQQLVMMEGAAADSSSRQAQAGQNAERMREVTSSPLVGQLKTDVARAESRLQELNSRLGGNHPQVQEAQATLKGLRSQLNDEMGNARAGVGVTARIDRSREIETRSAVEEQRQKLLKLKELRDEGAVLEREVENAQRTYDAVLNRFNQTNLESQNRQSSATILSQATPPQFPSSPKVLANMIMGLFLGLTGGLTLMFMIESFDKRVRTVGDISASLGLPVIGIMPTPVLGKRKGRQLALTQERVVHGRKYLQAPDQGAA